MTIRTFAITAISAYAVRHALCQSVQSAGVLLAGKQPAGLQSYTHSAAEGQSRLFPDADQTRRMDVGWWRAAGAGSDPDTDMAHLGHDTHGCATCDTQA